MLAKKAFTLAEVLVALSLALGASLIVYNVLLDTVRVSATAKLQQDFSAQARLLHTRFETDATGASLYQIGDRFDTTLRSAIGGGGGTILAFGYSPTLNTTSPVIHRVVCYYLDTTNAAKQGYYVLRRLDSDTSPTLDWKYLGTAPSTSQNLLQYLPPADAMQQGQPIAQIDYAAGNAKNLPKYQLFYAQQGTVNASLLLRYGTGTTAYIAPIQLNFFVRK